MVPPVQGTSQQVIIIQTVRSKSISQRLTSPLQTRGFGPHPQVVICDKCGHNGYTQTSAEPGILTWLIAGGCVLLGCEEKCIVGVREEVDFSDCGWAAVSYRSVWTVHRI